MRERLSRAGGENLGAGPFAATVVGFGGIERAERLGGGDDHGEAVGLIDEELEVGGPVDEADEADERDVEELGRVGEDALGEMNGGAAFIEGERYG